MHREQLFKSLMINNAFTLSGRKQKQFILIEVILNYYGMPTKIRLKRTLALYKDTTSPPFLRWGYHYCVDTEVIENECLFSAKKRCGAVGDFLRPRT